MTTAAATATMAEVATTSAPESLDPRGRSDPGAAAARTEELFRQHGRMVGGLCRGLLRDRTEAEDAAQQVFLSAHRALLNGSHPRESAAWLATIARNECVARVRARMRTPLATDDVEQQSALPDPLAEAIRRADLAALWRAIRQLPAPQREALLLREFGGLTYDELAVALAVSESAVESLLFRARSALRTRLEPVYAAFSGASWVEALGRLFAGGSSLAAPAAAKIVALGVGAAVVTGGAVVGPQVLEHHPRHAATAADRRQATPGQAAAGSLPGFIASATRSPLTRMVRSGAGDGQAADGQAAENTGRQEAEPSDHAQGGGESSSGGSTSGGDGRESATPPTGGHDGGNVSGGESGKGGGDGGTASSTEPSTASTGTEPATSTQEPTTTTEPSTTSTEQPTTATEPITTTTVTVPIVGDVGG